MGFGMVDLYDPRMYESEERIRMKKSLINGFLRGKDVEDLVIFIFIFVCVCEIDR